VTCLFMLIQLEPAVLGIGVLLVGIGIVVVVLYERNRER